jgi:tetratricopeptide (TPR) repeat protein
MHPATYIYRPHIRCLANGTEFWVLPMASPGSQRLHLGRCALRILFLSCLLISAPPLFALGTAVADQHPILLLPHEPAFAHLPRGSFVVFALVARAGQGTEILIETSAPNADFQVLAPSGRALLVANVKEPGWAIILFPVAESGQYQLVVRQEVAQEENSGISLRADLLQFNSADMEDRVRAAKLFSDAQLLAQSPDSSPLRSAIDQYRRAARIWAAHGDREGEALALASEARTWLYLSQYNNALAALSHARLVGLQMPFFRAWFANLQAEVYLDKWDSEPAMRSAQEATRFGRGLQDAWFTAEALAARGEAEYLTGDPASRGDIENAVILSRDNNASGTLARALRCESWIEGDEGHVARAMTLMHEAEAEFQAAGQIRNTVDAMANLATIQGMNGNPYAALMRHFSLMPVIQKSGKLADLGFVLLNVANDYLALNRVSDALAYYEQTVETFHKIGLLSGESIGMSQLCLAETRADRLRQAMRDCSQSKAIATQLHDPKRVAITIWRLGKVEQALGNTLQAIANFRQAYTISASVHDTHSEAQSLMDWGDSLETLGNHTNARALFAKSLPLSLDAEDASEQLEARYRIARTEVEAGEYKMAEDDLVVALRSIDAQRRSVVNADLQASYFAQVSKCHELYVELLMRRHKRDPFAGYGERALEVSESGRALTLLDKLSARGPTLSSPQPGRPHELLKMQIAVDRAYDERLKLMLENAKKTDLDANEAVLAKAIDMLERTEDERRAESTSVGQTALPLTASEIATASRKIDFALVEYALGDNQSYVWVIDHGKINSYVLPARRIIESAVKEWRTLATARVARPGETFDETRKRVEAADVKLPRVAARLSCMLLGSFLDPHMDHLAIVPDGEIDLLPFAALPENGCDGGTEPLAARRQTVLVPSLSILLLPHHAPDHESWRGEIALLADPVFDAGDARVHQIGVPGGNNSVRKDLALPRLYGTRAEAMAIATLAGPDRSALYLDFDASLQTLLDPDLSQYRILHLATHGILDENAPGLSGIVLSLVNREGQPVSGYLMRRDVENLSLRSDLVVLGSCDSGSGPNFSGEGVMGLNHAFLSAGASRVISTLWSVDDEISKELIVAFYSAMLKDGLGAAEALRRSQTKLMRNPTTSPPYYWAGFTITSTAAN